MSLASVVALLVLALGPTQGNPVTAPPGQCPSLTAAVARERWTAERTSRAVKGLLASDPSRFELDFRCRTTSGATIADLRGISLSNLRVGPTAIALQGVDFSHARLRRVLFDGTPLSRSYYDGTQLEDVTFRQADLSNSVFTNIRSSQGLLEFENVIVSDLRWSNSRVPGVVFDNATFIGATFEKVDLPSAFVVDTRFVDLDATGLVLWDAFFSNASLQFRKGQNIDLSYARGPSLDLSDSRIENIKLDRARLDTLRLAGTRLHAPVFGGADLFRYDLRPIIWLSYTLGDQAGLEGNERGHHGERIARETMEHQMIHQHYRQLVGYYRTVGQTGTANGFYVAWRRFERSHSTSPLKRLINLVQDWTDRFNTAPSILLRTAGMVWLTACLLLLGCGLLQRAVHRRETTARGKYITSLKGAAVASLVGLFLFADKLLNVDGVLREFGVARPKIAGLSRIVIASEGLLGVYLAIRAVSMVA